MNMAVKPPRQESAGHGPHLTPAGVMFRIWAPAVPRMGLSVDGRATVTMRSEANGWHALALPRTGAGTRYHFVLPDGTRVPDPASRFQPFDVHGRSEVVDPHAFRWTDAGWTGRPWHEAVLYELHVGTFT